MKIALCSSFVPFLYGGARNIVEWLQAMLEKEGHQVERIYLPEIDAPDLLFQQMAAFRWIDLSAADRVICFRPQSHLIQHPHKILWFIHHLRVFYDLWDSPYRGFEDDLRHRGLRDALHQADTAALKEARHIFTNSQVVSDRLKHFNGIDSEVLYPPVFDAERFHSRGLSDEIVYVCRLEHHKRQHLLVEAMAQTRTPVRLRLCGASSGSGYPDGLNEQIVRLGLQDRVILENRWITEEEKVDYLADCLAAAYLPLDEDSYGYPSVEASHARKALLTTTDSGGVLELVRDGDNGFVAEPTPQALAVAMDKLYADRGRTAAMGERALARLDELNISWSHVVKRLLA
ncbi:glycosyltransferase family 4 protein [Massilia sp. Mn16-1_5]|uniref:glycosyltransferase family 4 protein n=1 Tax=Massilia sp. Mn16-1_5 TaxID=2079199 RepID=UPI00109E731C|nr:glycosyltransferase family 4 protein [Massilia sp. Mn16-1_5]THC45655.1 glycosyl transferase family 1 [Massilia sp. Mn16-1_5]